MYQLKSLALLIFILAGCNSAPNDNTNVKNSDHLSLSITIPDRVGTFIPGKSNYSDIVRVLGEPELTEHSVSKYTTGEFLHLRYPSKGLEFSINKQKQMRVTRIEAYKPFKGSSAEGLKLGISIEEARNIINVKYGPPSMELQGYLSWDIPTPFTLKHDSGVVVAIKMLGD